MYRISYVLKYVMENLHTKLGNNNERTSNINMTSKFDTQNCMYSWRVNRRVLMCSVLITTLSSDSSVPMNKTALQNLLHLLSLPSGNCCIRFYICKTLHNFINPSACIFITSIWHISLNFSSLNTCTPPVAGKCDNRSCYEQS